MKKLLSMLLCSLMVLSVTQNVVHAEEDNTATTKTTIPEDQIIKNDETGIPDTILYSNALRCGDSNSDGVLTKVEALQIVEMEYLAPKNSTVSLKGLSLLKNVNMFGYGEGGGYQFFENKHIKLTNQEELLKMPNLTYLSFTYADNVDLSVISQLQKVNELSVWCSSFVDNRKLSSLSNMKDLRQFDIRFHNEGLTAYDLDLISNCQQLTDLDLWGNKISTVKPLSKMTGLLSLRVWDNLVKDFSPLLSLTNLKKLDIQENLIKNLPNLKVLTNLEELSIGDNFLIKEDILKKVSSKFTSNEDFMNRALRQRTDVPDIEDKPSISVGDLDRPYDKPLDSIPNNFVDKIYDAKDGVVVTLSKGVTVNPEIFIVAAKEKKTVMFEVLDDSGKLQYSWTFNADKKADTSISTKDSVNLAMNFNDDKKQQIEKLTNVKDSFYMNFSYHGTLPLGAKMKVKVDSKYKNGDKVFLYYFNEEKNTVNSVNNYALVVKDGYVEFDITHCSTYFLSKESNEKPTTPPTNQTVDRPKTSDEVNATMFISLMLGSIAVTYFLRKKRLS